MNHCSECKGGQAAWKQEEARGTMEKGGRKVGTKPDPEILVLWLFGCLVVCLLACLLAWLSSLCGSVSLSTRLEVRRFSLVAPFKRLLLVLLFLLFCGSRYWLFFVYVLAYLVSRYTRFLRFSHASASFVLCFPFFCFCSFPPIFLSFSSFVCVARSRPIKGS